jgi:hypothetical protein
MKKTRSETWVAQITNNATGVQVSKNAGIPQGTYWRQIQDDKLTAENIVKIARAYDAASIDGLVAVGIIEEKDVLAVSHRDSLASATDDALVAEIMRRLKDKPEDEGGVFDIEAREASRHIH